MQYKKFEINNFKGIENAEISLSSNGAARVYTLVGLNESGKTTLLEAIHSLSPDSEAEIVAGKLAAPKWYSSHPVPRHMISDFTGTVSVRATLVFEKNDKERLKHAYKKEQLNLDTSILDNEFAYEKLKMYENGELKGHYFDTSLNIMVKKDQQRKYREATEADLQIMSKEMPNLMPALAYFPTFVFEFPEKIYLSGRDASAVNAFYRRLFQDILDYGDRKHTIEQHIVSRLEKKDYKSENGNFLQAFNSSNEKEKIKQVIDFAAQTVTRLVFEKWNRIFKDNVKGKEIQIEWGVEEGPERKLETGKLVGADQFDIWIRFEVKDGGINFPVHTRSLGFRWFFSFLLFTQCRASRDVNQPVVFLFDEPASNLHASAQQKLIETFPEISKPPHTLIYTTHSHYMIEPKWLEQTYIVENTASVNSNKYMETVSDVPVNVTATPYRQFVNQNPSKTSYFQPILDRLDIVPSKFDFEKGGIIVEGKSDYYILHYINEHYVKKDVKLFPAHGAGTLGALIAMMRGWGLPVRIVLDSDEQGKREKQRYQEEYSLNSEEITTLEYILPDLKEIEDLFTPSDRDVIKAKFQSVSELNKKQIRTVIQEHLAAKEKLEFDTAFTERAILLLTKLKEFSK